jgi:hypothetical protein
MPVFSTLGALTYTKVYLGDTYYWYIETAPISSNNVLNAFDINNENIYWVGSIYNPANSSVLWPNFINVLNSNFSLPTNPYHAFYKGSLANGTIGQATDVSFDSTSNLIYFVSSQNQGSGGGSTPVSIVRTLDPATFALQNTYVDLATATNRDRTPKFIETHANGTYTVSGLSQEVSPSNDVVYVTNFTSNTKNWAKILDMTGIIGFNVTSNNSFVLSGFSNLNNHILELSGNGNNILRQYSLGLSTSASYITTDTSNNIYYGIGDAAITNFGKIDSSGNIVWQKQMSANVQTTSAMQISALTWGDGNLFVSGIANAPGGNTAQGLPLAIMSVDANSGNINWQRRFYEANINFATGDTSLKYDNYALYVGSTQSTGTGYGYMIKIPSSGAIPGNGSYSNNLLYQTSNVSITNGNITISNGNIVLSNAVSTAVVTSNTSANTANLYTFNSTRLS